MARFLFWSDLHCEFSDFEIPLPGDLPNASPEAPMREEVDAILIAGDTDLKGRHVDFAIRSWDLWRVPVLMIDGNHEPYGFKRIQKLWSFEDERIAMARHLGVDIQMMRGDTRIIGDTRVIGATLWTDMQLWPEQAGLCLSVIKEQMNDYRKIRFFDENREVYRKLIPQDTIAMHRHEKQRILEALATPFNGRTIVMTHHMPIVQMVNPRYAIRRDPVTAAYASDLWDDIRPHAVDAWICGHSHNGIEILMEGDQGPVRFLQNTRGYPDEETAFDPLRILDSHAPRPRWEMDEGFRP